MRDGVDDLPVFDKCVFHLVGERSTEERSQREGAGEEKRAPRREGRKLREGNGVSKDTEGWERHKEKKLSELC